MTLPFQMPPADVFLNSSKRVLAHYFEPYPLQIDNVAANVDYYARNYLMPSGESNKFLSQGGLLRTRPLAVTPLLGANYALLNKQSEVKQALSVGISGFTYDILDRIDALSTTGKMATLLQAAQSIDPRFWIIPMLDMGALVDVTQTQAVAQIGRAHV